MLSFLLYALLPLAVGSLATLLTGNGMMIYSMLLQPPLSPAPIVFPIVWTVLYLLMGIASWLVSRTDIPEAQKKRALILYGVQLGVNFLWPLLFFGLGNFWLAFACILLLDVLVLMTLRQFLRISTVAGLLLAPYLVWVLFATYLNLGIAILN